MSQKIKLRRATTAISSGTVGRTIELPRADYNLTKLIGDRSDFPRGSGQGVNTSLDRNGASIRRLARYLVRMDGLAAHAVDVLQDYAIGEGLQPSIPDDDQDLMRLWRRWSKRAGAETLTDLSEVQGAAFREMVVGGEAFGILRYRQGRRAEGLAVPLQVQVAPAEMVPSVSDYVMNGTHPNGGVLYGNDGTPESYYLYKQHPGELGELYQMPSTETVKFPAAMVAHLYMPGESAQRRGVSWLSRAAVRINDMERYLGADLLRKVLSANIAYWLELPDLTAEEKEERRDVFYDPATGKYVNSEGDAVEAPQEESLVAPKDGSVAVMPAGGKIHQTAAPESGNSFSPFIRQIALHIAASVNVPVEFLLGDMSGINDRLYKAVASQFERHINRLRRVFAARFLNPVWNAWIRTAVAEGAWVVPEGKVLEDYLDPEWVGQPMPQLHRLQEIQAFELEVEQGFATHSDIVRRRGDDPDRVRRERLDDLVRDIETGLAEVPAHWTDRVIRERLGWSVAEISEYRTRTENQ